MEQRGAATGEISRNVQEAASGTQEVNDSNSGVSEVGTEAGQSTGEVLLAAREMSSHANSLKQNIDAFLNGVKAA